MNDTRFNPTRLRRARGKQSVEAVAAAVGVSHQTIRNWESGQSEPDASLLAAVASFLGRPLDWFFQRGRAA